MRITFDCLQRDMRVTEDDEVDPGEPAAKSRQPTLPRACVVDHAYPQAGQVKFGGHCSSLTKAAPHSPSRAEHGAQISRIRKEATHHLHLRGAAIILLSDRSLCGPV
jgi:hypothetical protein